MRDFQKEVFSIFKSNLHGLPSFCRLVMYELFEHTDFSSGKILINSLDLLARTDFYVDPLRGRAKEEITGDTIRNALRTIKKAKSDHFIFSTVNQRIVIEMPFVRELYESFYCVIPNFAEVLVEDIAESKILSQLGEEPNVKPLITEEVDRVLAAASLDDAFNALADAPAKIKPKNNNKQTTKRESFVDLKKPIDRNFYPSAKTIELALEKGFVKVTSDIEIKRFVMYNEASLSRWADYNPVFLKWLETDHNPLEFAATSSVQRHLRKNHGSNRSTHQVTSIQSAIFDSNQRNLQIIADEERERKACGVIEGEYCEFVDVAHIAV